MKKILLTLSLLLFFSVIIVIQAQKPISVVNETMQMSKGEVPAYLVEIPQADYDQTVKNWSKLIRQNTKDKVVEVGHEIHINNTIIEEISPNPIEIYSSIVRGDSSVKLISVFFIDSLFFSPKEKSSVDKEKIHANIEHFLKTFATSEYKYGVETELANEEKILKGLNKELNDLTKENENLHKSIKENEQDISDSEHAIQSYELDNERKQVEINAHKETMAGLSDQSELYDQAKSQLKDLEKDKKNISGKIEKEQKNIVKYKANIEEANREIERNLEKQEQKKQQIKNQEQVTDAIRLKLSGIK
jgi:hypothetical protein